MKVFRNTAAFAANIMIACVILWIILPGHLRAQTLPQVYFISEFNTSQSTPHYSEGYQYYYGHTADNPLVVNTVRSARTYHSEGGTTTIDTTYAFSGSFEQHDGYFICRSPGGTPNTGLITYRTSKITNDGYYLEDDYSDDLNNINPFHRTRYTYNDDMKLVRTIHKTYSNWHKYECEIDSLGRRLQEVEYSSADSLSWTPIYRTRYFYTGNPTSFTADFEKYLCYPPSRYNLSPGGMPLYVNNDWEIGSYGLSGWYCDEWTTESIGNFILNETTTGYFMYCYMSYLAWDINGLPTCLNSPNGYEEPGYRLVYSHTSQVDVDDDLVPETASLSCLYDAYPNPFRKGESVCVKTEIVERETGTLSLFNLRGQCVASNALCGGTQQTTFSSQGLPSGIYLYQLRTNNFTETKKLVLLK